MDTAGHGRSSTSPLYIAVLGFAGLLLEAVGVWLVFGWASAGAGRLDDPRLFLGAVLAIAGFVALTRWLAAVVKALVR
ncbi:MAG: hypothetical protein SVU88_02865 [Candidatus Nanohaloarchaea archaeon]|nr:hypothetical protein [Candidatus Nanohaloarchaea archaeon]